MDIRSYPYICIQRAGEIIYIPQEWTHATINLGNLPKMISGKNAFLKFLHK